MLLVVVYFMYSGKTEEKTAAKRRTEFVIWGKILPLPKGVCDTSQEEPSKIRGPSCETFFATSGNVYANAVYAEKNAQFTYRTVCCRKRELSFIIFHVQMCQGQWVTNTIYNLYKLCHQTHTIVLPQLVGSKHDNKCFLYINEKYTLLKTTKNLSFSS